MKKIIAFNFLFLSLAILWSGCEKQNYAGGMVSPYIPLYDLRGIYKGEEVTLTTKNMFGSDKITGVVISDHSGGNMPTGLLVLQDKRRLNQLRGISIPLGADASNYVSGDSVVIKVEGGVLKRIDGLLQITGLTANDVEKVASGVTIPPNRVPSRDILMNPDKYESTLVAIVKGGFDPLPAPTDILLGDKVLNDGFENINLHTEASATFANKANLPVVGNFFGIIFNSTNAAGELVPQHRLRNADDIVYLSSTIEISPVIIAGFMADVRGGDGNYEYMQFMATRDIDFSVTPFSVVVTNNAGATKPTGFPTEGWATGKLATPGGNSRTYKFDLTSGFAAKGTFFYVGGSTKMINGSGSTVLSAANWIVTKNYVSNDGDGFGNKTSGLFANSGNASGFAIFEGTEVTRTSVPVDVVFIGKGGSLHDSNAPSKGYLIANTDFYDKIDPITLLEQPYYQSGSNTINFNYLSADMGYFNKLGGIYNPALGKWVLARTQTAVLLSKESTLEELEGIYPLGTDPDNPEDLGVLPTSLKSTN